jgi:hypothetical protein
MGEKKEEKPKKKLPKKPPLETIEITMERKVKKKGK